MKPSKKEFILPDTSSLRKVLMGGILSSFIVGLPSYAVSFDEDYDEAPWEEIAVKLPPPPEDKNLIAFDVGNKVDTKFLVDGQSISVDSDGVIRFILVIVSNSGAKNISYDGIRCETYERRTYAFGRPDGTWSKARSDKWQKIKSGANQYSELFGNYFCRVGEAPLRNPEDARRSLRGEGRSNASS